jgi:head-tail adaptor
MFKPSAQQLSTAIRVQQRIETDLNGAPDISYVSAPAIEFCAWKGKGGTESTTSGALTVTDTAEVTMWYRPGISERDRLLLNDDAALAYDVINIEDVEQRHMWLILKVSRAVNG